MSLHLSYRRPITFAIPRDYKFGQCSTLPSSYLLRTHVCSIARAVRCRLVCFRDPPARALVYWRTCVCAVCRDRRIPSPSHQAGWRVIIYAFPTPFTSNYPLTITASRHEANSSCKGLGASARGSIARCTRRALRRFRIMREIVRRLGRLADPASRAHEPVHCGSRCRYIFSTDGQLRLQSPGITNMGNVVPCHLRTCCAPMSARSRERCAAG